MLMVSPDTGAVALVLLIGAFARLRTLLIALGFRRRSWGELRTLHTAHAAV
jgi:hypothetical protein